MRIDKYLKLSRLIKRRTIAQQACEKERVVINGRMAKASTKVTVGDVIEITFGNRTSKIKVTQVLEHTTKDGAKEMYEIL